VATLRISAHVSHPPKQQKGSEYLPIHPADIRFLFASPSAFAAGENCRRFIDCSGNLRAKLFAIILIYGLHSCDNRVIIEATHIGGFADERSG
jgi:hypothetical protein